jgi:hypothetical protein
MHRIESAPQAATVRASRMVCEPGRPGDHWAVFQLLLATEQGLSEVDFQAWLDHPDYQPSQRLLLRHDSELVGHVRLAPRQMVVDSSVVPAIELAEFTVLPEYRLTRYAGLLLDTAIEHAVRLGAHVVSIDTCHPDPFLSRGWTVAEPMRIAYGSPRDLLSRLANSPEACDDPSVVVRPCRYIEKDALVRLYERATCGAIGPWQRDLAHWDWLLMRHAYDRILVAIPRRAARRNPLGAADAIVAYAFIRGNTIAETVVDVPHESAALALLHRAAADAIERDDHRLRAIMPLSSSPWARTCESLFPHIAMGGESGRLPRSCLWFATRSRTRPSGHADLATTGNWWRPVLDDLARLS